jgi:nuclear pore complex protein Nup188
MSSFGLNQRNREYLDSDPESQRLQARIRDSTLLIALEAMCLSSIVELPTDEDGIYEDDRGLGTMLRSKEHILSVHLFLLENSEDLVANQSEGSSKTGDLSDWPMSIICLAWSVVLRSLPGELQPSSLGYEQEMYIEFAERALRLRSGLFPWLEWVLSGPLFSAVGGGRTDGIDMVRRKVIKG